MSGRVTRALVGLTALLSLLPSAAHEASHAAAGRVLADDASLDLSPWEAEAHAYISGLDDATRWGATLVCLAPTILGTWLAVLVFAWWVLAGYTLPAAVTGWARLALAGLVWGIYTTPSGQDVDRARYYARGGEDAR